MNQYYDMLAIHFTLSTSHMYTETDAIGNLILFVTRIAFSRYRLDYLKSNFRNCGATRMQVQGKCVQIIVRFTKKLAKHTELTERLQTRPCYTWL